MASVQKNIKLPKVDLGVFGGSGFYKFLNNVKEYAVKTPYGEPSAKVAVAEMKGKTVAFLPRHGKNHEAPPHMINYRANVYALKMLGAKAIVSPCASGSLQAHVKPGDFVVCDQVVDRTNSRKDTFYDGPKIVHISLADPYNEDLRKIAIQAIKDNKVPCHEKGTIVVIQGPRFSSKAESKWFTHMGWDVINMTQYPEVTLAKEVAIPFVNISLITDYDAGLVGEGIEPCTAEEIIKTFVSNNEKLVKVLNRFIELFPKNFTSNAEAELKAAVLHE
ncbi:MAG: S-methyl-5'-thioadenosine phosphorylase [Candidatus Margulisbacteria bacterium]|nr:S-methyl-5'-thioadenosine phosphorylase [Candidatus Margulisiibacteriota bacterium]